MLIDSGQVQGCGSLFQENARVPQSYTIVLQSRQMISRELAKVECAKTGLPLTLPCVMYGSCQVSPQYNHKDLQEKGCPLFWRPLRLLRHIKSFASLILVSEYYVINEERASLYVCNGHKGYKGRCQNSPQKDDKNMLENIGDLFVKCHKSQKAICTICWGYRIIL